MSLTPISSWLRSISFNSSSPISDGFIYFLSVIDARMQLARSHFFQIIKSIKRASGSASSRRIPLIKILNRLKCSFHHPFHPHTNFFTEIISRSLKE
ncbi:hypothetical protein HN51_025834 [Arachis hypogaea]